MSYIFRKFSSGIAAITLAFTTVLCAFGAHAQEVLAPRGDLEIREPLVSIWRRQPVLGENLRPLLTMAERRESDGGAVIASRLAHFCSQVREIAVRPASSGNDLDGLAQRQILEKAKASCSQVLPAEARAIDLLHRLLNPDLKDPYALAYKRVVESTNNPDPKLRIKAAILAANSGVFESLNSLVAGISVSFEGQAYRVAHFADFDQTSTLLSYAANIATCDFGLDCSPTGLDFALNCIGSKIACRAKDVREQHVFQAIELAPSESPKALRLRILGLSERLTKAIKAKNTSAFLSASQS